MKLSVETLSIDKMKVIVESSKETNFRRPSEQTIARYCHDMKSGKWHLNGETVKFNCDGTLRDGLHRLIAAIRAGIPLTTAVAYEVSDDGGVDQGRRRTLAQWLSSLGYQNCNALSSIISNSILCQKGHWKGNQYRSVTVDDGLSFLRTHESRLLKSVALSIRCKRVIQASICGVIVFHGCARSFELGEYYCDTLNSGKSQHEDDPVVTLREKLLLDRAATHRKLTLTTTKALAVIAWNKLCQGESLSRLTWKSVGPGSSEFPTIQEAGGDV